MNNRGSLIERGGSRGKQSRMRVTTRTAQEDGYVHIHLSGTSQERGAVGGGGRERKDRPWQAGILMGANNLLSPPLYSLSRNRRRQMLFYRLCYLNSKIVISFNV
jgi:hypothetical protein